MQRERRLKAAGIEAELQPCLSSGRITGKHNLEAPGSHSCFRGFDS
jgi:hypothetical protein